MKQCRSIEICGLENSKDVHHCYFHAFKIKAETLTLLLLSAKYTFRIFWKPLHKMIYNYANPYALVTEDFAKKYDITF